MKLLLTSSGFTNKTITDALLSLANKPFKDLKLVFVTTAANLEEESKEWLIDDLYNAKKLGFREIDVVDIALPKKIWFSRLTSADILMFGGGDVYYLIKCLNKSGLAKLIPEILETKIYVGISAGSMVTAKTVSLSSTSILYYNKKGNFKKTAGLGLVDFEIRPHLNSPHFPHVTVKSLEELSKKFPGTFYAIDDETAVKVVGVKVEVVSEGEWKKFN